MAKRLVRKLTDVAAEVKQQLINEYNITEKQFDAWKIAASATGFKFPDSTTIPIADLYIDYEVQRDVLHKHVLGIIKKFDPRICSPVSACRLSTNNRIDAYDGQHRTIAVAILGFTDIPCAVVETDDPNFASYAFEMLNDTGVKKLNPGDLHRNALVRYKNGSREIKNVRAYTMQQQFDANKIDLQDKNSRGSINLKGDNFHFFSHFKYAQKAIDLDESGKTLNNILKTIKEVFPAQEEIDQGVFIGLYELQRLARTSPNIKLPANWMKTVLESVAKTFNSSNMIHSKAKVQWEHLNPGASWSAPSAMANFLREMHIRNSAKYNLTKLDLPTHGAGAAMGITANNIAPGLIPPGL